MLQFMGSQRVGNNLGIEQLPERGKEIIYSRSVNNSIQFKLVKKKKKLRETCRINYSSCGPIDSQKTHD